MTMSDGPGLRFALSDVEETLVGPSPGHDRAPVAGNAT
jgi:hypothetical protein